LQKPPAPPITEPGLSLPPPDPSAQKFRFGNQTGKRYGLEILGIFAIKLPLLLVIWLLFIQPWSHSAQDAQVAVARIYRIAGVTPSHD
jgi:hypothetical protein